MRSNQDRSLSQFSASPCMVTPFATRAPIAPTFRLGRSGLPGSPRIHVPDRPATLVAATPNSAHTPIIASSSART